jgi:hypothetical protein
MTACPAFAPLAPRSAAPATSSDRLAPLADHPHSFHRTSTDLSTAHRTFQAHPMNVPLYPMMTSGCVTENVSGSCSIIHALASLGASPAMPVPSASPRNPSGLPNGQLCSLCAHPHHLELHPDICQMPAVKTSPTFFTFGRKKEPLQCAERLLRRMSTCQSQRRFYGRHLADHEEQP